MHFTDANLWNLVSNSKIQELNIFRSDSLIMKLKMLLDFAMIKMDKQIFVQWLIQNCIILRWRRKVSPTHNSTRKKKPRFSRVVQQFDFFKCNVDLNPCLLESMIRLIQLVESLLYGLGSIPLIHFWSLVALLSFYI